MHSNVWIDHYYLTESKSISIGTVAIFLFLMYDEWSDVLGIHLMIFISSKFEPSSLIHDRSQSWLS